MNPEPIWDWPSSVQFLGWYRVEGESSKFRNSVGYITAMNVLQCNAMATDAIMAKHSPVRTKLGLAPQVGFEPTTLRLTAPEICFSGTRRCVATRYDWIRYPAPLQTLRLTPGPRLAAT